MDGKRLIFIDIVEVVYDLGHLLWRCDVFVTTDHLGESHLTYSDHATPSCVSYVGAFQVVIELGETGAIGEPGGADECLIEKFVLLFVILWIDGYGLS